jgi:hypothetical protein
LAGNEDELFAGGDDDMRIKHMAANVALEQLIRLDFLDGHLGTVSFGLRTHRGTGAARATLAKGGIKSNPGKPHGGRDGHAIRA